MHFFLRHKRWLIPTLLLGLMTPFTPSLDLALSGFFYQGAEGKFTNNSFLEFIFHYAQAPAFLAAGIATLLFSYTRIFQRARADSCLLLILAMLLGPGLLVNGILKEHWGRPRPRQIVEFGGHSPFRPFWEPALLLKEGNRFKSFPSGHATMGFYFLTLYVVGRRSRNAPLAIAGLLLALVLGGLLSFTRIAQGGHFFSDILFAAYFSWIIALSLDWLIFTKPYENTHKKAV